MKKPDNVKELCEFMCYLEEKYNLLDFEIEGVKPWQADRIEIYYQLGRLFGVFEKELKRGMGSLEKIKSFLIFIKNSFIYNPLFNLKKVDFLIFSHPRSKFVKGKLIDIYSYYFLEDNKDKKYIEFEEHFNGRHIRAYNKNKRYLDYINLIRNIKDKFVKIKFSDSQLKSIEAAEKEINRYVKFDLKNRLIKRTKKFLTVYPIYKKILINTGVKELYLIVSYGRAELIKAAKDLNIKSIELQHGTFSKYHLGYSFPNNQNIEYFPDEFWVWNDYWKNLIEFPIEAERIKIYPFKYLEYEKNRYKKEKIKNQIIILGQGGLSDRMAKKIIDNIEFFKDKKIFFKLHPEEYGKSHLYKNLSELKNIKEDMEIIEDVNLYEYLAKSEYQAGVFSTALYEGVEFGCKSILFNLPGIEYMDKFIKMYKVKVV